MWKYQCKTYILSLLGGFIAGVLLSVIAMSQGLDLSAFSFPSEAVSYVQSNPIYFYIMGGMSIAGIVNVVLFIHFAGTQLNFSPFILIMALMFFTSQVLLLGTLLVVPAIFICIYGILTSKSDVQREFHKTKLNNDEEIFRIYQNNHKLDSSMQTLAQACRANMMRITYIYALGIVAVLFVVTWISNTIVLVITLLFYFAALSFLLRYRSTSVIPIAALLYEECDPEACASAIFYFSQSPWSKKIRIRQHALLAQCLIYLDDPELAQDVLISYPKKDAASTLQYWSLMSYVYYLLKDESDLSRCKQQADRVQFNSGTMGVMIQSEEKKAIQNKIDLMNGELNTAKKYYLHALKQAKFPFQQVDASYYIGLISFVEEDYVLAKLYFNKVVDFGNKIVFVNKAKKYLKMMESMDNEIKEESVY